MTTINSDVATNLNDGDGVDSAADAFLARFLPAEDTDASKKKPSENEGTPSESDQTTDQKTTEGEPEENEETKDASDESPEGDEESEGSEDKAKKYVEDENHFVKIKVGDEEHEIPVSQLKRLHGQEAALTKRSQAVAERAKQIDSEAAKVTAKLGVMLTQARQNWEPYSKIDFLALAKNPDVSQEELSALRNEAQKRWNELQFVEGESNEFIGAIQQRQQTELVTQAQECLKQLADPASPNFIDGWSQTLYKDIVSYAADQGLAKEIVHNLVDPSAYKLLHKAMLYDKGVAKVTTQKVNKTVKKVIKTSKSMSAEQRSGRTGKAEKALASLRQDSSTENVANAFLSRWEDKTADE